MGNSIHKAQVFELEYRIRRLNRLRVVAETVLKALARRQENRDISNLYWLEKDRLMPKPKRKVRK